MADKKKALIVWGGWDGHTPKQCADIFAPILQDEGFDVEVSNTLASYEDVDNLKTLSLIVPIWTMGTIEGPQLKGLLDAVHSGVGIAGFHGGMIDSFRTQCGYQMMTGGQFVGHPGNTIPAHTVNITDKSHPITAGINDFVLPDTEQYYNHVDPGVHVLATTTFTGEHGDKSTYVAGTVMPYAWTRQWGLGRVFVASWGHSFKDFDVPQAKEIVRRGMIWAAR